MKSIGVIPSRLGSSRFPNKPLCKIRGMSMIEHVYKRSLLCDSINELIVATCDIEIKKHVEDFGGKVIMTSGSHERCTDRIAEAVKNLDFDIVVNIQGDEPMVHPDMITNSIENIKNDKNTKSVNNISKIYNKSEFTDPNNVKVVFNKFNEAIYFSREPIPSDKKLEIPDSFYGYKQVCIISFIKEYLFEFNKLKQTHLEIIESIDMLRCIENKHLIKVVETKYPNWSVDTKQDLNIVSEMMVKDILFGKY